MSAAVASSPVHLMSSPSPTQPPPFRGHVPPSSWGIAAVGAAAAAATTTTTTAGSFSANSSASTAVGSSHPPPHPLVAFQLSGSHSPQAIQVPRYPPSCSSFVLTSVSDPDWIRIQSGQWIRIRVQEAK
jgi:hypothetical protein